MFGAKALIPIEFKLNTLRTNDTFELSQALNELEEKRDQAAIRMAEYHRRAFRWREKIIKPRAFSKGDLVLRQTFEEGKLKSNWEGPFIIANEGSKRAYRIRYYCSKVEARPWNLAYLKKYFH